MVRPEEDFLSRKESTITGRLLRMGGRMKRRTFLEAAAAGLLFSASGSALKAETADHAAGADVTFNKLPRWRGFNLLEKFTHKPDEWQKVAPFWGYNNEPFRESDFEWIREFGFDFVRLPVSYKCWTEENDWYRLVEKHLKEIDQAVEYGRQYGLHVCINFHRAPGYTINDMHFDQQHREQQSVWDDAEALEACAYHWKLFAERYKGLPNRLVSFNLFNEPSGVAREKHDRVIRRLVGEIRAVDPARLIVIDGLNFRPCESLLDLELVQSARGYAPGEITHYKATWAQDRGEYAWPTWPLTNPSNILWNRERLIEHYEPWKAIERKGAGVYVGEFGAYNRSPHEAVLSWMADILSIWKDNNWGWAMWCFRGPFGILDSGRQDVEYESFRGSRLDRKMLELLKAW